MNIKDIGLIANHSLMTTEQKERAITAIIAMDKNVIPNILAILESERKSKDSLIKDQNAELSRALVVLKSPCLKWNKSIIADPKWVVSEIIKHYKKWKGTIGCCFNVEELED